MQVITYSEAGIVISEEDVIAPPSPRWQSFMDRLDLPSESNPNGTGLFGVMLSINEASSWQGYNMLLRFISEQGGDRELRTLGFIYGSIGQALSNEQLNQLHSAIEEFNIPINLGG